MDESQNESLEYDPLTLTEKVRLHVPVSTLTDQQKEDRVAFESYMAARNIQIPRPGEISRDVAREVIRAMELRKRDIGPGVDRGGCTLVTQAMRETFVDNPGVRRVIG